MKNFKKNQVVIFVIALMLMTAGYLNFTNENGNLLPTSSLADSEQMASIGDATLVSANESEQNNNKVEEGKDQSTTKQIQESKEQLTTNQVGNTLTTSSENINETQNTVQNSNEVSSANVEKNKTDSYFAQSRLDRDNMYSQMLANYQTILETENVSSEEKTNAQTEIKNINKEKNAIMIAENLIKTKGFEDVVLFVNNGNVSSIIKAEKLDENQIAQIQNIITRELEVKVNKINVSSKN